MPSAQNNEYPPGEWAPKPFEANPEALRDLAVEGLVICESPNLEGDALMLKKLYQAQEEKRPGRA